MPTVDVNEAKELLHRHLIIPPRKDAPFHYKPVDLISRLDYLCGTQERLNQSVMNWIRAFNGSTNYNGLIACPELHEFANSALSDELFSEFMLELFQLKHAFDVMFEGEIYLVWCLTTEKPTIPEVDDVECYVL